MDKESPKSKKVLQPASTKPQLGVEQPANRIDQIGLSPLRHAHQQVQAEASITKRIGREVIECPSFQPLSYEHSANGGRNIARSPPLEAIAQREEINNPPKFQRQFQDDNQHIDEMEVHVEQRAAQHHPFVPVELPLAQQVQKAERSPQQEEKPLIDGAFSLNQHKRDHPLRAQLSILQQYRVEVQIYPFGEFTPQPIINRRTTLDFTVSFEEADHALQNDPSWSQSQSQSYSFGKKYDKFKSGESLNESLSKHSSNYVSFDLKALDDRLQGRLAKILRPEERHASVIVDQAHSISNNEAVPFLSNQQAIPLQDGPESFDQELAQVIQSITSRSLALNSIEINNFNFLRCCQLVDETNQCYKVYDVNIWLLSWSIESNDSAEHILNNPDLGGFTLLHDYFIWDYPYLEDSRYNVSYLNGNIV